MQQENSETPVAPDVTMSSSSATEITVQPSTDAEMREQQSTAADSITPSASERAATVDKPEDNKQGAKDGQEDQKENGNNENSVKFYKGLQN